MSVEFLRQIAATPLPSSFTAAKDIDAIKILRQAGLVLALMDDPPECAARVLAITAKGRDELLRFHYPDDHGPRLHTPGGHFKLPHLWPVKFLQAGRSNYEMLEVSRAMRAAASLRR